MKSSLPMRAVKGGRFTLAATCATAPAMAGEIMTTTSAAEDDTARASAPSDAEHATVGGRIRTVVASVLVLVILAAAAFAAIALVRGTWMVTPILSGSMRPGLAVGGVAISERVPVGDLGVRDVIVFQRPDQPSEQVVHRIVGLSKGSSGQILIRTQGDANTVRDPWTLTIRGDYAYRVRWSIPLLGYVAIAFENHRGIALLVAGVVLLGLALSMVFTPRRRQGPRHRRSYRRKQGQADATPPAPPAASAGEPRASWTAVRRTPADTAAPLHGVPETQSPVEAPTPLDPREPPSEPDTQLTVATEPGPNESGQ
jgi:signal peptidase I